MAIVRNADPASSSGDDALCAAGTESGSSVSNASSGPSEVDSGMDSDNLDYAGLGEAGAEVCQVEGLSCLLPYELYDLPDLLGVLSLEAWNECLTEDERFALSAHLPDMDQETFMLTLRGLFAGENMHFGSPVRCLFEQLKGGQCEPRVVLYRRGLNYLQRREHFYRVAEYHNSMVGTLVQMRDLWEGCAGYSVEERLRLLSLQSSRRRLGYGGEHGRKVGSKMDVESGESFMARWSRRLNDVGKLHYSPDASAATLPYRSRQQEEPVKFRKEQVVGARMVSGLKGPLEKGDNAKVGYAVGGPNSRRMPPLVSSRLDKPGVFDQSYGGNIRVRHKVRDISRERFDDLDVEEEGYGFSGFKSKVKHGNEQQNFNRRHDYSLSPLGYAEEENEDYVAAGLFSRKDDASQFPSGVLDDLRALKKSMFLGMERGASAKSSHDHVVMKGGEWDDTATGYLRPQKGSSIHREDNSTGNPSRNSERSSRKRQSEKEDLYSFPRKSVSVAFPDRSTQIAAWNIREKKSQNSGRGVEHVKSRSPFYRNEVTDSDSSEQVEEEEPVFMQSKKSKLSNLSTEKHQNYIQGSVRDFDSAKKTIKKTKRNGGLPLMPDEETFKSAGLKTQTRAYATKSPSHIKVSDAQKYMYEVKEEIKEDHYGDRQELALVNSHSAERLKKGLDTEQPQPNMHDYLGGISMETYVPDAICGLVGLSGNAMSGHDINGQLSMPLSGCKSAAAKKKQDKPRQQHSGTEKLTDVVSKKNGKRKVEDDCSVMTPDQVSAQKEVVEPEPKPLRKPFTPITPTFHTGFSFSIVHLLSAVRKAMIAVGTDYSAECGNAGNADAVSTEGQKGMPSLTIQEIVTCVRSNPGDPCILETQEPLHDLVRGVLKIFSSKTAPPGAKAWKPLVMYEKTTKSWSWVGPLLPSTADPVEEETSPEAWDVPHKMLVKLVDAFANWLKSGQETLRKIGSLPPPPIIPLPNLDEKERFKELRAQKSLSTISASSNEVREYFRKEEFLRYQVPERAFSYTAADGRKSIVAPLRRGGGKPTSKARDHFMLKPGRPPHVTILCLVRDAAARLPGSIGTRADVCILIRDSQYIVEDVSDIQVNHIVSGALDRLHYERDPCVQFDSERKLWVYLHREREEEDFEDDGTSSTKKWKRPKKDAAENVDGDTVLDQDVGILSMFELNADHSIDPSSAQMGEKSELLYSDIRPTDENVEPLVTSMQGSSQGQQLPWDVMEMNAVQHGNQMLCQNNCTNEDFDDDETYGRGRTDVLRNNRML